jgi:DNA-binding NtrC family response regulator
MRISPAMIGTLQNYSFPGNARELKNIIESAVVLSDQSNIDAFLSASLEKNSGPLLPTVSRTSFSAPVDFTDTMNRLEKQLLTASRQHCRTTREMADFLNISQPSVVRKLKKHGL